MSDNHELKGMDYWYPDFPLCIRREREFFSLPQHTHDFLEIHFVAEGKGYHYIGDERIYVSSGDIFVIPVGTRHVYRPSSAAAKDELIVYNCFFDPSILGKLGLAHSLPERLAELLTDDLRAYRKYKDTHFEARSCMEIMHLEFAAKRPGHESVIYGQLTRLLVCMYRLEIERSPLGSLPWRMEAVLQRIDEAYAESLTLKQLAGLLPASVSHLQRLFKLTTDQSFTEYLQNVRIAKSRELLLQTTQSVKEIAASVGYEDTKFFHRLFRKKTGMTPGGYRKKGRDPD